MKWKHQDIQDKIDELYQFHGNNGEALLKFKAEEFYNEFGDNDLTFEEWITELKHPFDSMKREIVKSLPEKFARTSTLDKRSSPVGYETDVDGEVWLNLELIKEE